LRSEVSEEDYYDYSARGPPQRIDPSIYQEILAESQTPAQEEELNILNPEGGMSLQQLEEMMIREVHSTRPYSIHSIIGNSTLHGWKW
jgi:hypothetical protein